MAHNGELQNPDPALQIHFLRCSRCGALMTCRAAQKLFDETEPARSMCEACALAQPGVEDAV